MSIAINDTIVPIIIDTGVDTNVISRLSTYKPFTAETILNDTSY